MKPVEKCTVEAQGFRGFLYAADMPARNYMLLLAGDGGDDFLSRAFARWIAECQHCHALCIAVQQDPAGDSGVHSWPVDRIEGAVQWLKQRGAERIGILGISMQAALALTAASRIGEISLTVAFTPCDFVPWGFVHGRIGRSKNGEWPSGGAAFAWRGEDLPFQPACLEGEAYWQMFCTAQKEHREMHSIDLFEYSEKQHPIREESRIPAEQIEGRLMLIGAEDDSMWNTAKYIRRLEQRCEKRPPTVLLYPYGTHLLVPQGLLSGALPLVGGLVPRLFASGRKHPKACKEARIDLEQKLTAVFEAWKAGQ